MGYQRKKEDVKRKKNRYDKDKVSKKMDHQKKVIRKHRTEDEY